MKHHARTTSPSIRTRFGIVVGGLGLLGAVSAVGVVGFIGCGDPMTEEAPRSTAGPADPLDIRAVGEGEIIYLANCASCHGANRQGQPNWQEALPDGSYPAPPHDGTGHTWRHSDPQLFEATKFGGNFNAAEGWVSHMPAFENVLSDDEIWDALAFVKSRWPAELQPRQRLLNRIDSRRERAEGAAEAIE